MSGTAPDDVDLGKAFTDLGMSPKPPQMTIKDMDRQLAKQLYVTVYTGFLARIEGTPHTTKNDKAHEHASAAVRNFNKMDWDK